MNIRLSRSFDVDILDAIIRDASVYPFVSDDACPSAEDYTCRALVEDDGNIFLLVYGDYAPVGCFIFLGDELHTCMLPECRGRAAIEAGKQAIAYFFAEKDFPEIRSFAFDEMPQTIWYANMIGLRQVGEPFTHTQTRNGEALTRINFKKERP